MATRDDRVLAALVIGSGFVAFCGLAYVLIRAFDSSDANSGASRPTIPDDVREIRVITDQLGLSKSPFFKHVANCYTVNDIAIGDFHESAGDEVLLAECQGVRVLDLAGQTLSSSRFASPMWFPKIHRTGAGNKDWIAVDQGVWGQVKAVSGSNQVLWSRGTGGIWYRVAVGNLDEDRLPEFIVWKIETTGLEFLDHDGSVLRTIETRDFIRDVVILEGEHPKDTRICYSITDREMVFLDVLGNETARIKPKAPALHYMEPVDWPELYPSKIFLQTNWAALYFLTFDGESVATFTSPSLKDRLYWGPARSATVRFAGNPGSYFVLLLRLHNLPRSVLHIYDRSGALVYHEILEGEVGGLGVLLDEEGNASSILIGGKTEVVSYKPTGRNAKGADAERTSVGKTSKTRHDD